MSEATPAVGEEQVDPAWWEDCVSGRDLEQPEVLATDFEARLRQEDLGALERQVLEALAIATSALLQPDNWLEPFKPMMMWDNKRSALPSDLTAEQIVVLGEVAPLIKATTLRARVADIAWFYGNRGAVELLTMAIDAYRACPLEREDWATVGEESWQRALQLAKRLGRERSVVVQPMCDAMRDRILTAGLADGYFVTRLSRLLNNSARLPVEVAGRLAERFVELASQALPLDQRLSRHFEREALSWFGRSGQANEANACGARIVETYVVAADTRMAEGLSGALVAGLEIEKAISSLRELPRSYRQANGLDLRIDQLRARLDDLRQATVEAMVTIEGETIDLEPYATGAMALVSGRTPFEALGRFANIYSLSDKDESYEQVRQQTAGTIAGLFPRATFSRDGRKVAASGGIDDDGFMWSEVVRNFRYRVELVTGGLILPSRERLIIEHLYRLDFFQALCLESPFVPPGHERLWARGLWHGFNDDFPSAVSVLVPQLEQSVRVRLKASGVNTIITDEATGVETEKGLGTLLVQEGVEDLLGSGLTLELRALLVDKDGANLRNEIAHGLITDDGSWSYSAVYCWWLMLRLVVLPVWILYRETESSSEPVAEASSATDDAAS
ncbi:DUF4209 domain-containing protein [Kribbella sp. NPDC051587]|uniref:DUF4209 domain-containing protein n=1 Tax=Kribbella sp. NPDC051587 TaxID=3364119 RepID=UPI00378FC0E5